MVNVCVQHFILCKLPKNKLTNANILCPVLRFALVPARTNLTISRMKASITHALLNSSHGTHRAIIIARTVTGCRLKGPDRRPVGNRVPLCDCRAVQHTTHYITPHCLSCILPTHIFPIQANDDGRGRGSFLGGQHATSFPHLHQRRVLSTEVCRW